MTAEEIKTCITKAFEQELSVIVIRELGCGATSLVRTAFPQTEHFNARNWIKSKEDFINFVADRQEMVVIEDSCDQLDYHLLIEAMKTKCFIFMVQPSQLIPVGLSQRCIVIDLTVE